METCKNKIQVIIKTIIAIVLGLFIHIAVIGIFLLANLLACRCPNEELERALDFLKDEQYIGMTIEDCEEIFGEYDGSTEAQVIVYPAGYYQHGLTAEYEIYIFFDEEGKVKAAKLKEVIDI